MKKEKIGLIFVTSIFISFIIGAVLQLLNLENSNPEVHKIIFFTIAILAASSGLLLWGMCIWDCLGNKQIKSQNLVFAALIVFSWVASIFYYFKFIYKRSERQELRQ